MALQGGTSKQGGSMGAKIAEGIFGKIGTIKVAKQKLNEKLGSYEPDLYVTIEVDSGGQFNDEIDLFGNFSREQTGPDEYKGPIKGWGSAGRIDRVLQELGVYEGLSEAEATLNTDELPIIIPEEWLNSLLGMKVHYLLHVSGRNPDTGKPYWNAFHSVRKVNEEDSEEEVKAKYESIKTELYSDDYHFQKLQKGRDALEATGGTTEERPTGQPKEPSSSIDDDLPI